MAMTKERLASIKEVATKSRGLACLFGDEALELIAEVERLQAEASRLELENLELDLQVTWDHGRPSEIDRAQAAVDAARSQRSL